MRAWAIVAALAFASSAIPLRAMGAPSETQRPSTAVLGLDGGDLAASEAVTAALRRAMERRGFGLGASKVTVAELRLASGCVDDEPACLAEGAKALDAEQVIYGALYEDAGHVRVDLMLLAVTSGVVDVQITTPLSPDELRSENIDATADRLVASLIGDEEPEPHASAPVEPVVVDDSPAAGSEEPTAKRNGKYEWGAYSPRPRWKRALLGGSLAVTGVGVILVGIGFGASTGLADKIRAAAADSEMDGNHDGDTTLGPDGLPQQGSVPNDVPGGADTNLCKVALHKPNPNSSAVWNADVATLCERGRTLRRIGNVGAGLLAVGLAGTITAITLMFVRRRPTRARQFGIAPSLSGVAVHGRF